MDETEHVTGENKKQRREAVQTKAKDKVNGNGTGTITRVKNGIPTDAGSRNNITSNKEIHKDT
jgi:hypothetical protein